MFRYIAKSGGFRFRYVTSTENGWKVAGKKASIIVDSWDKVEKLLKNYVEF